LFLVKLDQNERDEADGADEEGSGKADRGEAISGKLAGGSKG
jgi:hypothetical protein